MSDSPAFEIGGVKYPIPTTFRLGDPVLVTELTGMAFPQFAEALDEVMNQVGGPDAGNIDPTILFGLVGVAVWQANPRWTRDKVRAFVERIPVDGLTVAGGEEGPEEAVPPAPAGDISVPSPETQTE